MADNELFFLSSRHGASSSCTTCGRILNFGMWGVGILHEGVRYTLGVTPAPICCGSEQPAMALYDTKESAQKARQAVEEALGQEAQDALIWFEGYPATMDIVTQLV